MKKNLLVTLALSLCLFASSPALAASNCCVPHDEPGCDDGAIQTCVCAQDEFCCSDGWDEFCVNEVAEFGCGDCGGEPPAVCGDGTCNGMETCTNCPQDCGQCPVGTGDCCQPNGTPGCDNPTISACVCAQDDFCCSDGWDEVCVGEVTEFGCGECGPEPGCGNGQCEAPGETCFTCSADCGDCQYTGDCCLDNGTPGCQDKAIADCVCVQDPFCCTDGWDDVCVGEVVEFGCGECETSPDCGNGTCDEGENCIECPADCGECTGTGDCCEPQETPGCQDGPVAQCVCIQDAFCCVEQWDEQCVAEVTQFGCGECATGEDCGNGTCDTAESCISCPLDCGSCAGEGDCCHPNATPGCEDAAIADCVCAKDMFCCESEWDSFCVDQVTEFGCGDCGDAAGCGDGTCAVDEDCIVCPEDCGFCPGEGDCCLGNGTPGCQDKAIQDCVCAEDAFCCQSEWDDICASEVESLGCGDCIGGPPECGDGLCAIGETCETCPEDCGPCGGTGDCCEPQEGPGCEDPTVQACVCEEDSFCCGYTWDQVCVDEVAEFDCGDCDGGGCGNGACDDDEDCLTCPEDCGECQGSGCCQPHATPGCDDAAVQDCVCEEDAYCCEEEWDGVCVDEVDGMGCGSCGSEGPVCGNGECESGESCEKCAQDCGQCPGTGDCCEEHDTPGCNDYSIQYCVCSKSAYCCNTKWDEGCVDLVEAENCGSCSACIPDCMGWVCGGDGCGGSCGTCPQGQSCQEGKCEDTGGACVPDCVMKDCGTDGCGGTCGTCGPSYKCHGGKCLKDQCKPDCHGKKCGPDGCGGTCGQCPGNQYCLSGHCKTTCEPDCHGKQCGPDGCGGTCGSCPFGTFCTANGHCADECQPNCTGKMCGGDGCGGSCGTCPPGKNCNAQGHCTSSCQPDCHGIQCGGDGCGGTCGTCPVDQICNNQGHCVSGCTPNCVNKECGSDGCGGGCGECGFGHICTAANKCEEVCVPDCLNKECGEDGCGGMCGSCGFDQTCSKVGICIECTPDCAGRQCGDDGCGGSCGGCPAPLVCYEAGGQCMEEDEIPDDADAIGADADDGQECPEGHVFKYGKCIEVGGGTDDASDSGCSATGGASSASPSMLLLFALLALVGLARKRQSGAS